MMKSLYRFRAIHVPGCEIMFSRNRSERACARKKGLTFVIAAAVLAGLFAVMPLATQNAMGYSTPEQEWHGLSRTLSCSLGAR